MNVEKAEKTPVESAEMLESQSAAERRAEQDRRRPQDRRRSARGLFELRARRDRVVEDRRRSDRRNGPRFRFAFWKRSASDA